MERGVPGSSLDRGYLVGLAGVLISEAAGVGYQLATGIPVPQITVIATAFVVACLVRIHGLRSTMTFLALVFAIPFASEFVGVLTGVPYGPYAYAGMPGPWLFGLVPLFIFIAWVNISYLAIATTTLATGRSSLWLAPLDGLVAVAWDAMVDPLAVRAGYWAWSAPGGLYGVPVSNFLGWFLVVTLLSVAVRAVWARDRSAPAQLSRTMASILPALLLGSSASFAVLALLGGMPLAAVVGLPILVAAVGLAWSRVRPVAPGPATPSPWARPTRTVRPSRTEAELERT